MNRPLPEFTAEHLRALSRNNFGFFCRGAMRTLLPATDLKWNWHLDVIANRMEDVMAGRCRRLIIAIPPRSGKTLIASVSLPAFILGQKPEAEVVCASYSQSLSDKMAADSRRLMNSRYYHDLFGSRLTSPRARLSELKTPQGGSRLATSVEGTLTGRGGDFIIIDDPLKPDEADSEPRRKSVNDWYDGTVTTRPNDKETGAIIVIMQRLHEDDLVGHLIEQGMWDVLSLPAIAEEDEVHVIRTPFGTRTHYRKSGEALHPDRESLERIAEARLVMGSYRFAAHYQQRPAPAGGGLVMREWFPRFDPTRLPKFEAIVQSWDTASKVTELSDFSVCTTWGRVGRQRYLLHVLRKRLEYPDLKRAVLEQARLFNANTVVIEDSAAGIALIQELRRDGFYKAVGVKPLGDKAMRLRNQTAIMEAGMVFLPNDAAWLEPWLHELTMFPVARYDDQADSTSQALAYMDAQYPGQGFYEWMIKDMEDGDDEDD